MSISKLEKINAKDKNVMEAYVNLRSFTKINESSKQRYRK